MKKLYLLIALLVQVSVVFSQTHFVKGFIGSGTDQMTIVIKSADIGGTALQANDEIAVYDGNLCVGVVVLTGEIIPGSPAIITASAEGGTGGDNGFNSGHKMYFRFWDSSDGDGKEYHNIIPIVKDNADNVIANQFVSSLTVFVNASTANTTKTFTGATVGLWNFSTNWSPAGIPEPNSDVIIPLLVPLRQPNIYPTDMAYCGSLTFTGASSLTIQSDNTGSGSLIVAADVAGATTVNTQRYMTDNAWHLISSQVSGQTISSFLSTNSDIPTNGSSRGMMDYNESSDDWNDYFENTNSDYISPGKGYCIRTDAASSVTFLGSLSNVDVTTSVTRSPDPGNGWNLIGNPYTSAIYTRQEVFGFLTVNAGALDENYRAIYLWDHVAGAYTIINSGQGESKLASGQGFFVKAASAGSVNFKQTMQVHQTDAPFKSAIIDAPTVILKAKTGDIQSSTRINFNEEMTVGLDPGYDAGILKSGKGFDIYSRLVADNGVNFAIQWLPGVSADRYIIPVGIDAVKGGEIVFSAQSLNLPFGFEVILEDKLTQTNTNLKSGELYVANVASDLKGTGRFYLHVGSSVQTAIKELQKEDILVYTIGQTMYIKGNVSSEAQFLVYSIDGRLIKQVGAKSQNLNQINIAGYAPGVYFVNVMDYVKHKPVKFVVGK